MSKQPSKKIALLIACLPKEEKEVFLMKMEPSIRESVTHCIQQLNEIFDAERGVPIAFSDILTLCKYKSDAFVDYETRVAAREFSKEEQLLYAVMMEKKQRKQHLARFQLDKVFSRSSEASQKTVETIEVLLKELNQEVESP
ncbi:hypothetical protein [Pleionea sp. CnH1-48]|uniref:hypothetical protein n=1 Tax=Pleionea sp. CnH1-48 TaxID=2954494 RepID=UPI002097E358|nr:hypothetical protein [Pleionea sp. CnH1-48]MCO7223712.1 hypothetical protein [Pleionea sp. CnH1-48]